MELFGYAYPEGLCWAARSTFAQDLGISKSSVSRLIREVEQLGYVVVHYRPRGTVRTNVYIVPKAVKLSIAHKPRSEDAVRAMCLKLEVPFDERYVRKGPGHPGIDEEVWVAAQGLYDRFAVRGAELVAFLEKNLAAQGRSPEAVAAAARRRAS